MEELQKLNLGCGLAYRPGYINIDMHERSVADMHADVSDLPFEPNSVKAIEAVQLLEHFDLVHCKYVLSEWFRVLAPRGALSIETPDLKASLKKLSSSKKGERASAVQWLYGIDSPGLQHKGGFTYETLVEILSSIGFEDVRRSPARTHTYAPGMRVECTKPADPGASQFIASLRKRVKKNLGCDDSFVLIPFEEELAALKIKIGDPARLERIKVREVVSLAAVWNPAVSIAFLNECVSSGVLREAELANDFEVARYLSEIRFHERALTLWMKSRKQTDSEKEFSRFAERLRLTVNELFEHPELRERILEYVVTLDPTPIEIFDLCLMKQKAGALLSSGILRFHKGDLHGAETCFIESSKMDPQNLLAHWNLARLGVALGRPDESILSHYADAVSLAKDRHVKDKLDREKRLIGSGAKTQDSAKPISEYDLID